LRVNQLVHEADHSPSTSAKVQNAWSYTSTTLLLYHTVTDNGGEKNPDTFNFRAVTDSINYLIDVCTSAAPGQKECDNAIRKIQSMRPLLDNPTEPHSDCTYFECLDTVMEKSKSLGESVLIGFLSCLLLSTYVAGFMKPYIKRFYNVELVKMVYRI
jgi:hypothetical protein